MHAAAAALRQRTPLNPKPPEYYVFVHVHLLLLLLHPSEYLLWMNKCTIGSTPFRMQWMNE